MGTEMPDGPLMSNKHARDLTEHVQAFAGHGPFAVEEAARHGISHKRLARGARTGTLRRVTRGHYALRDDPLDLARHHLDRLHRRGVHGVVGGITAAGIWGIPVFGAAGPVSDPPLTILVPRGSDIRRGTRNGVRLRIADIAPPQITSVHGVAITTPLRTGVDVARDLGRCRTSALLPMSGGMRAELAWFLGGEVPAGAREVTNRLQQDPLVRADRFAVLGALVNESIGYGMKWARQVLCDVEPLLETALEGLAWSVLTDTDLPRPVPQRWLRGASGRSYRVDFLIGGAVIVEADGAGKYSTETPWQEKQRQHDLEAAGFWVVRCTWEELITRPHEVIARIRFALSRLAR